MIDFLEEVYGVSIQLLKGLKFNKSDERSRTIIALYATIIEQADSQISLLRANKLAGVEIIFRSTLEAFVDLVNLIKEPSYLDTMKAAYHKDTIKLMRDSIKGENPFLSMIDDAEKYQERLERNIKALGDLTSRGVKQMGVSDRFHMTGFGAVYSSIYRSLCAESHNNVGALTQRHFRIENGKWNVVIFKIPDSLNVLTIQDSLTGALCSAGLFTHDHFRSNAVAELQEYLERLQEHRSSYP